MRIRTPEPVRNFLRHIHIHRRLRALMFLVSGALVVTSWHFTLFPLFALVYSNEQIGAISRIDNTNVVVIAHHVFHVFAIFSTSNFYIVSLTGSYLNSHPSVDAYAGIHWELLALSVWLMIVAVGLFIFSPASKLHWVRGTARILTQMPSWIIFLLSWLFLGKTLGENNRHTTSDLRRVLLEDSGVTHASKAILAHLTVQPFVGFYLLYAAAIIGSIAAILGQIERKPELQATADYYADLDAPPVGNGISVFQGNTIFPLGQLKKSGNALKFILSVSKIGTLARIVIAFL
jgi:hypothetical protein